MFHRRAHAVCVALLCLTAVTAYGQTSCPSPVIVQIAGTNPSCGAQLVTLDAGSGWTSYQWSTGATTRTISDTPPATTTYSVTAIDANGCSATSVPYQVTVVAAPETPVIHPAEESVCPGSYGTASVDPPSGGGSWSSFSWAAEHATTSGSLTQSRLSFYADSSGLPINLTVSVTDANGCPATATASLPVRTIAAPVIHLNADAVCPGAYGSAYIDSPEPVNGPNGWSTVHWTIDHGTINYESGSAVSFTTDPAGRVATLTVTATDNYGCTNSATATVNVRSVPPPVIHLNADAVCPGAYGSAYIDSPEPVNGPNGWSTVHWTIDHGTITYESGSSVSFSTDATGLPATLTVTATDSYGCTNSASAAVPVRVLTPPAITTASPDVCPTSEVHATVAPPDVMQSWSSISWSATNARITSSNTNSADIFAMATGDGPVTLTVTVTDTYGCSVTSTRTVPLTINPPTAV